MANSKVTQLTAATAITDDDLLYVVNDPLVTPASRKITVANMAASSTQRGLVELATTTEAAAGVDTARAVTPAGVGSYAYKVVSLRHYGAVGDGIADDSTAIAAAIATGVTLNNIYGQSRPGRILIQFEPGKIYKTTIPINLCYMQGITLDGGGPNLGGAVIHSHATDKAAIEIIGSQNIWLRGIEIYGDQTDRPAVGVFVSRSTGAHGSMGLQITFDHVAFYGYYVNACYYGVETETNTFRNCILLPIAVGDATVYIGKGNDLAITPDNATLLDGDNGLYNVNFYDCQISAPDNARAIYCRDMITHGLTLRDTYVYGNSGTQPTIEIEGSGKIQLDNVLFEGLPGTRLKFTYKALTSNYFFGSITNTVWNACQNYLIYADDNTDLRNFYFTECHTMSTSGGVYAPVSLYATYYCDFSGLGYYQGGVFGITVRSFAAGCEFKTGPNDTVTFSGQHYSNFIKNVGLWNPDTFQFDGAYTSLSFGNGAWNGGHLIMGTAHIWFSAAGDLYIKFGVPANETDGTIIGTQS